MEIIKIDKKAWDSGLAKSGKEYLLYGPMKVDNKPFSEFRALAADEVPDMSATDTRLSPKSIAFPPSEVMLTYSLDENSEDCNIMKAPDRAVTPGSSSAFGRMMRQPIFL